MTVAVLLNSDIHKLCPALVPSSSQREAGVLGVLQQSVVSKGLHSKSYYFDGNQLLYALFIAWGLFVGLKHLWKAQSIFSHCHHDMVYARDCSRPVYPPLSTFFFLSDPPVQLQPPL